MHTNPLEPGWLGALSMAATTVFVLCLAGLLAALTAMGIGHRSHDDRLAALGYTCASVAVIAGIAAGVALVYTSFTPTAGSFR